MFKSLRSSDNLRVLRGKLLVLEGPDGVGKTTLSHHLKGWLCSQGIECEVFSFPGQQEGSLGKLVYEIHHNPSHFGLGGLSEGGLQMLHVGAHLDAITSHILPALKSGTTVILDRYWWSTVAYGIAGGMDRDLLDHLICIEKIAWCNVYPAMIFLIDCTEAHRPELDRSKWTELKDQYDSLLQSQTECPSVRIGNDRSIEQAVEQLKLRLNALVASSSSFSKSLVEDDCSQIHLVSTESNATAFHPLQDNPEYRNTVKVCSSNTVKMKTPSKLIGPAIPSPVYDTLWWLAAERQAVFFRRLLEEPPPWTDDPVLNRHKFTNAYRASDRASQFLIRNVIYGGIQSPEEVLFRILLFKFFNKIETWTLLSRKLGVISYRDYEYSRYDEVFSDAMAAGKTIYSPAYIMPSGKSAFGHSRKHRNHLKLLDRMMSDGLVDQIKSMNSMEQVFALLKSYPMMGDFLAYQLAIDINYSELTDFDEMAFVVPGPGARGGISKCFCDLGGLRHVDIIRRMADIQELEFKRLGLNFQNLWGRPLQLIDIQSLFCEVDKYARVAYPDIAGEGGRTRIKQIFRPNAEPIEVWYPPKWGINERITVWKRKIYESDKSEYRG